MTYILIAYTNIRELIPGYPDAAMRQHIRTNAMKLDSLEHEQFVRDQYFENLNRIISGEVPEMYMNDTSGMVDSQGYKFYSLHQRFHIKTTGRSRRAVQAQCPGRWTGK